MTQRLQPSARRRALLSSRMRSWTGARPEADLQRAGFRRLRILLANAVTQARCLAMSNTNPTLFWMDVNLEGGREGTAAARGF